MMHLGKALHVVIASATHNQLLIVSTFTAPAVWNALVLHNFKRMFAEGKHVPGVMIANHATIPQALQARDGKAAALAMREHITHVSL